jgi:hypothetical protein
LTTAQTPLQAPEHFAGKLFCPTTTTVLVDLIPVVLIENATNKHPVTITLGDAEVNEIDGFRIGFALGMLKPDN